MNLAQKILIGSLLIAPLSGQTPDPGSLIFSKWTRDFQVPDPVAISFDEKGRAYVTQTQRRKANDLDIRNNRDWIPNDLSFTSPDDKRAFYQKVFTAENSSKNKRRVKDYNKDGRHDILDLQALTERIHLIEDTDGDGLADKTSIYAENFHDQIAGIAAGVLHHDGDVYTTIVPDVWKLRDTNNDGKADQREAIAHGFGVHLAYAGHDMHGLTVGPDGRIYWTIGDKGVSVKTKEGLHYKYPNQGAVLRCEPDGSNFEVYARGLRNVQEIAFDQYGNLFGIDNDSDRPGEKERFVYIVQHMDAGWRANWQYRKNEFNPWMDENLSVPWQKDQPAYITPPISLYHNGPAGLTFNPGTALGQEWQNYFFHTSAPNGQQWAFQVEQDGASFKMVNEMQIGNGVPIVGINFGPDGALYGVDWGGGYPLNNKGAVWKWDVKNKHPLREQTAKMLRADFSKIKTDELITALHHPDQRIRLKAQFELVKRDAFKALDRAARKGTQISRIHAIWGLGQLARKEKNPDLETLAGITTDPDPEICAQATKAIGEALCSPLALHQAPSPPETGHPVARHLIPLLSHPSGRVRFFASIALGNLGAPEAVKPLLDSLRALRDHPDPYSRHAVIIALTGCASSEVLASLSSETNDHENRWVETAAVVALRRRGDPAVARFLSSAYGEVQVEAARAIHDDWIIPEAMPELAAVLVNSTFIMNESLSLRAINANFHLGSQKEAERVARLAALGGPATKLRLAALDALSKWTTPPPLDRVVGRYRPLPKRDPKIAKSAVEKILPKLLTDPEQEFQTKGMELARDLKITLPPETLLSITEANSSLPQLKIEALRNLDSQNHSSLKDALNAALKSRNAPVRIEALKILAKINANAALDIIKPLLTDKSGNLSEQQAALSLLAGKLASPKGDDLLSSLTKDLSKQKPALHLDLLEAAAVRKLKAPAPAFTHTLSGGDATRGQDLFMNHLAAQCIRCHKVAKGKGSDIGPNLQSVGLKERTHLLESIIEPQKIITDGYGTISLTLKDGKSAAGLFLREKSGVIEIRDPEGKTSKVKSSDVRERSPVISTMPPMGQILKKREIRDLIEYLSTLKVN